jgi:hypothetical protein
VSVNTLRKLPAALRISSRLQHELQGLRVGARKGNPSHNSSVEAIELLERRRALRRRRCTRRWANYGLNKPALLSEVSRSYGPRRYMDDSAPVKEKGSWYWVSFLRASKWQTNFPIRLAYRKIRVQSPQTAWSRHTIDAIGRQIGFSTIIHYMNASTITVFNEELGISSRERQCCRPSHGWIKYLYVYMPTQVCMYASLVPSD